MYAIYFMHIHVYEETVLDKLKLMMRNSGMRRSQGLSGYKDIRKQMNLMIKDAQ